MTNDPSTPAAESLRQLPAIDDVLRDESMSELLDRHGRERVAAWVRTAVNDVRRCVLESPDGQHRSELRSAVVERVQAYETEAQNEWLVPMINATGVILHTNLGRAPLAQRAVAAVAAAARYTNLEFDRADGRRGRRGAAVMRLLCELTGAEAALVVNNCAAATLAALQTIGRGREVVISRGQLVEIGGSYRLPEVFAAAGAALREVGTTNRTRLSDYADAINDQTAAVLRVHPSNFRIEGFTEQVAIEPIADLCRQNNIVCIDDLGSGCLFDLTPYRLPDEPTVPDSLNAGADLVLFSGDKLLGGPQCGLILGRQDLVAKIRANPLARALRVDKLTLAALEATLSIHLSGRALTEIPILAMISQTEQDVRNRAESVLAQVCSAVPDLRCDVVATQSTVGGGALPGRTLSSWGIRITGVSAEDLARRLRTGTPGILARIEEDAVICDLRTVQADEIATLVARLTQQ